MLIKRFIKQVFTIATAFLISFLSLCLIAIIIFSKLSSGDSTKIEENSVLSLNMSGRVVEWVPSSLFGSNKAMINFKDATEAIRQAAEDNRISAIYLNLSYLNGDLAILEEIREALWTCKKASKTIIAYADFYTHTSYYLASIADEIILNPSGYLGFKGFSSTTYFFTKLLENISVKPVIFRIGAYKSFVEPFCLTKMSEESKKQTKAYLDSSYDHFLTKIGDARNITVPALKEHAINLSAVLPKDALHAGLITKIAYETEGKKLLKEKLKSPSFVNYKVYNASQASSDEPNKIAVVVAEGNIIQGSSSLGYIGAYDFVKSLKEIQKDSNIKGVVLRINSPGGSVVASDIMWNAIEELKSIKPVVASMSSMAASGGYYIAAPCNYIFAQPTTLTGSIGIFGLLFDPAELMNKLGIHTDVVKTAPSSDFLAPRTTCSDFESKFMCKLLQTHYDDFLRKVSNGRGLSLDSVEKLAGGRVYTGSMAVNNGLINGLGGLKEAIAKVADLAKLNKKYSICYLPRPKTKLEQLLNYITGKAKIELFDTLVQECPLLNHYPVLSRRSHGLQAILPYKIHIE